MPNVSVAQVEQDLVLTRALVQLFSEPKLAGKIGLRGGTALHKLFISPACRYSEDIDLVQTLPGPIGAILDACRANLDSWLGKPVRSRAKGSASLVSRFESEIPSVRPLRSSKLRIFGQSGLPRKTKKARLLDLDQIEW